MARIRAVPSSCLGVTNDDEDAKRNADSKDDCAEVHDGVTDSRGKHKHENEKPKQNGTHVVCRIVLGVPFLRTTLTKVLPLHRTTSTMREFRGTMMRI
jgi:hypothetical protein